MEREELGAWLRLLLAPGLGPVSTRRLLAAFGSPEAVLTQSPTALRAVVNARQAEALQGGADSAPEGWRELLVRSWDWLHAPDATEQRAIVALGDPGYPAALLNMEDPPLLLHLMGRLEGLSEGRLWTGPLAERRCLAVVGSRNPTPQGVLNAQQFARSLGDAGLVIVSGLALGVDGAAHEGALNAQATHANPAGPATLAVVGTGLDQVYPKRHAALARRIAAQGVILSEYPLGTPPLAENFPRRNRLIAGLSCATLVVEAAPQSGSLITARLAVEQGKEVLAIPGSIHNPQSRGCHALIRQGAKLVESAQDVLEELPAWAGVALQTPASAASATSAKSTVAVDGEDAVDADEAEAHGSEPQDALLAALGADPVSLDALQARTGWPTAQLQAKLMALELNGEVARMPGGLLQRLVRA
ncbi:DNA-processing protein DprA [Hylemonella gracilis]|uniref:DNA protecting protein dpra n=1 Tax=Hylemonella gracilis ATCC 19624 TaxID=887062 RepID=F3KY16_9BURK|nr:DNA-processing protein DprA [Hylemonella gracilis]EGI75441.1 DNA protecting protein dpra [Hylemonella gracilis ATCC 19624]